mgnify:CR=1 FL=1
MRSVGRVTRVQGLRGATTADANTKYAILEATGELLGQLVEANGIQAEDIAAAFFTTTQDLNAEFPAVAARKLGWEHVALLCSHEMNVPGGLPRCLRVLMHVNTNRAPNEIRHVYLREATALRPDLATDHTEASS